jgi:hypothetical protein
MAGAYLVVQKLRLPSHKFRRLHLNEPGMPEGAYFDAEAVAACVVEGRRQLAPVPGVRYFALGRYVRRLTGRLRVGHRHTAPPKGRPSRTGW